MIKSIASILLILVTVVLNAQDVEINSIGKSFAPTNIRLQYAGNIGMFSIGPSWQFFKNRLGIGFSLGYVPKFSSNKPIYIASLKAAYTPNLNFNIKKLIVKPFSFGLVTSYTFGDRFNKYLNHNQYPDGYYWWNTAYRFGLFYEVEVGLKINSNTTNGLALYFEVSIWDLDIYNYTDNSNYNQLSPWSLITLGTGIKWYIK